MNYTDINDPDFDLMGYMTLPPALQLEDDSTDDDESIGSLPAVVILPVSFVDRTTSFCNFCLSARHLTSTTVVSIHS